MTGAIRGRLLSPAFARNILPSLPGAAAPSGEADRLLERIGDLADSALGPTASARAVTDVVLLPLIQALRLRVLRRRDEPDQVLLDAGGNGPVVVPMLIRGWSDDLDQGWRDVVRLGVIARVRWCLATNGRQLRIIDAQRTWSRHFMEVDVSALAHDGGIRRALWTVASNEPLTQVPAFLDLASRLSVAYGTDVCRSLGRGVVEALAALFRTLQPGWRLPGETGLLEQCLTVIYRILFLLFAEARGLVPVWHPLYNNHYTIGSIVTTLMAGRASRGLWRAVQAISRLAHAGCTAGSLTVTAFNGRLFAPDHTSGVDRCRIDDQVMRRVVLGLGTTNSPSQGTTRTRYDELDVEQLGSVYEHVLEYQPGPRAGSPLVRTRDARKASGTFYTPREVAATVVEQTLGPLVEGKTAEQILALRVLDPAMGSGAFLVAACRYLAQRVEGALVLQGRWHAAEVTDADRAAVRREIVQRCLYGVDLNPIAVQLARLSLWLVALANDKPLSFLDHHLVVGNSLVGASPSDIHRDTGASKTRRRSPRALTLFDEHELALTLGAARTLRTALALEPDDTVADVRGKERRLSSLTSPGSTLRKWKTILDLWCATWFWDSDRPPNRATFADITAGVLGERSALGPGWIADVLEASDALAEQERFLHWPLTFPEVFPSVVDHGDQVSGFDAVIGNPPWDMVRGDSGDERVRGARRDGARRLTSFVRSSGIYGLQAGAHLNRYALFTERVLQLVRHSGRVGLVLPGGILTDAGAALLRRQLLSTTSMDGIIGLDNRAGIFPIHRSVKFALITATSGEQTSAIRCRFSVSRLDDLEHGWNAANTLTLTRRMIERFSGADDCGVPELVSEHDLRIVEAITSGVPPLGGSDGWNVRFGRELNASDDRALMVPSPPGRVARPVVEGKVLSPFRVALDACRFALAPGVRTDRVTAQRARLAYREVASSTNRLTLIAAIVPAHAVATHTVFCLKSPIALDAQRVLCALLNSFVANYLVRMRVSTHVTAGIISRLRVPVVKAESEVFVRLLRMSRELSDSDEPVESLPAFFTLQAQVAGLYGLSCQDFAHVLKSFPLVPLETRDRCLEEFRSRHP